MTRTRRRKRPRMNLGQALADHQNKDGTVRDGTPTHASPSCQHHGGCPYCERNRTHASRRRAPLEE